jgi:hypothetical protein
MQAIIALSVAGLIEKYGAYAGLAAIPGLAVLSLLYFAQAREVRRLREWAGRAPERDLERSTSGVHVAPTGARDPVSVVRRQPPPAAARPTGAVAQPAAGQAASPAGAQASAPAKPAPSANPAPSPQGAPVPAAATAAAAVGAQGAAPTKEDEKPGADKSVAPAAPAAKPDDAAAPAPAPSPEAKPVASPSPVPATNGPGDPAKVERPAAPAARPAVDRPADRPLAPAAATAAGAAGARAAAPVSDRPAPAPARPATPGAAAARAAQLRADRPRATAPARGGRDPVPPRRAAAGGRPRRAAYIAVAAVLVIILVVVIVAATSGGDSKTKTPNKITPTQTGASSKKRAASPVPRGEVKVAVLNGTTQAGLAAQVGDQIAASGFQRGDVTNANDQQAPETVVYYASGQRRAGQEVADVVKASSVQPIDPDTQALAGSDAKVVVLVGADKT